MFTRDYGETRPHERPHPGWTVYIVRPQDKKGMFNVTQSNLYIVNQSTQLSTTPSEADAATTATCCCWHLTHKKRRAGHRTHNLLRRVAWITKTTTHLSHG